MHARTDMIDVHPLNDVWTEWAYGYVNIDKSYDYIVSLGMRPLVELSFLPQVIANCSRNSDPWNAPVGAPPCGGWFKYGAINGPFRTDDANQSTTVFARWGELIKDVSPRCRFPPNACCAVFLHACTRVCLPACSLSPVRFACPLPRANLTAVFCGGSLRSTLWHDMASKKLPLGTLSFGEHACLI